MIFLFAGLSADLYAQKQQSAYVEILGNGLLATANYDFDLTEDKWGARIGIGFVGGQQSSILTVPVMVRKLLGNNGNYFEVGAGATYASGRTDFDDFDSAVVGTLSLQYRRQPVDGGFTFKIGLTPLFADGFFLPLFPGLSLGYSW